jgi:hypothetical protein
MPMLEEYHYTNSIKFLPFAYSFVVLVSLFLIKLKRYGNALIFFLSFNIAVTAAYVSNGLLFPPSYLPDQYHYLGIGQLIVDYFSEGSTTILKYPLKPIIVASFFAPLYAAFGPSIFLGQLMNCIFTATLVTYVYNWLGGQLTRLKFCFAFVLLAYPSFYLWMTLNLREAFYMLCTAIALKSLTNKNFANFFWVCIPLTIVKFQVVLALLIAYLFSEMYVNKVHPRVIFSVFVVFLIIVYGFHVGYFAEKQFTMEYIVRLKSSMENEGGGSSVRSERDSSGVPVVNLKTVLIGYFRGNFMPLPGQSFKLSLLLSSMENFVLLLLFMTAFIRGLWYSFVKQYPMIFFYFLISSFLNSFVVSNLGTIMRYKLSYMYFAVVIFTILLIQDLGKYSRFKRDRA